jgi:methyltransferase (TIGR00027 family)
VETSPLEGVGGTSLGVARARAWEGRRPDRLFEDPYAAAFTAAASTGQARTPLSPERARMAYHVIIRTRFYDDFLLGACESGCRQVVLLAAGLDTRAYRLPWPAGVRLYELDLPEVLAFKDRVLTDRKAEPSCARTTLGVDLRGDWPERLTGAGYDPAARTAWLIEGLLVYLTAEEAAELLTRVGSLSATGSQVSFERNNAASVIAEQDRGGIDEYASLWKGGLGEDTAAWLNAHGWHTEIHELTEVAASYGRPTSSKSLSGFLTATRLGSAGRRACGGRDA